MTCSWHGSFGTMKNGFHRVLAHKYDTRNVYSSIWHAVTQHSTLFMRATLIKLTRWTRPYLIQERDSIVAFMSPRQWGRHVFLMSSHDDDRNELWNSAPCMFVAFLPSSRTPSSVTPYLRSHKRKTWNSCHCSFWINDL